MPVTVKTNWSPNLQIWTMATPIQALAVFLGATVNLESTGIGSGESVLFR